MNDPLIDEIRRVRRQISDELGPEMAGLVERYAKIENRFTKPPLTTQDRRAIHCTGVAEVEELGSDYPSPMSGVPAVTN